MSWATVTVVTKVMRCRHDNKGNKYTVLAAIDVALYENRRKPTWHGYVVTVAMKIKKSSSNESSRLE
jgi:hypothetical protein